MRAGSMLAEVSRTTCLISLAIILSFSKFTRPSTVESLPETKQNARDATRLHTQPRVIHQLSPSETGDILGRLQDHSET